VLTDGRQQRQPNHNTTTYCVLLSVSKHNMWSYYDCVYCCCRPSVNTICGRIMIGLSLLSSVSKHNIWWYYDWVVVVVFRRQQRHPNHNTTTYCIYWRTTTTTTQSLYDHILCLLTEDNENTICGDIMIGLSLLSSVSKHNMWSYYDWVVVVVFRLLTQHVVILWLGCRCCCPSVPHIMFTDARQQRQPNHNTTTYCVYWRKTTTTQS
jgi:hypothetical protein